MTEIRARSLICRVGFVMGALSTVILANYILIAYLGWSFFGWERFARDDPFTCQAAPLFGRCHADLSILIPPVLCSDLGFWGDRLPAIVGVSVLIWLLMSAGRRVLWS